MASTDTVTAIQNIGTRHMYDIAYNTDDKDFLKMWRKKIQECLTQHNSRSIQFLLATDNQGQDTITKRCMDVITKYSKPTWNFASSTRDLTLPTSTTNANEWIEHETGVNPNLFREQIRKIIKLYTTTTTGLFDSETRLHEKLTRLDAVATCINDLMFIESTSEIESLIGPTQTYLNSVLEKINISNDYLDMIEQYKRFVILNGIVSLTDFHKEKNPICTICMTKEVAYAVTPCGHTFCDDCCNKQITSCYICRVQIRDKLRLYFS